MLSGSFQCVFFGVYIYPLKGYIAKFQQNKPLNHKYWLYLGGLPLAIVRVFDFIFAKDYPAGCGVPVNKDGAGIVNNDTVPVARLQSVYGSSAYQFTAYPKDNMT